MQEVVVYTVDKVIHIFDPTIIKVLVSVLIIISYFLFGDLYNEGLMAVLMLVLLDTLMGVFAAYRCGEGVTSRKFGRVIVKGIVYFTAISAGFFADQTIPFNIVEATMIGFIGVTEFISIIETMGKLGYQTPKRLLGQLKEYQASR